MDGDRGLSTLTGADQWARCRHENTSLLDGGGVLLAWDDDSSPADKVTITPSGLAFDRWCRAYRSQPHRGRVVVHIQDEPVAECEDACAGDYACPTALAIDKAQRLYVVESGASRVAVADLWLRRLLRRIPVRDQVHRSRRAVDVASWCCRAYVLLAQPAGLAVLEGRRGPLAGPPLHPPRCAGELEPRKLAVRPDGAVLVLWCPPAGSDAPAVVATVAGETQVQVPGATDLDVAPDGMLAVAREPGRPLRRFRPDGGGWLELEPAAASGFDGGAIAIMPDGLVAFTTEAAFGRAAGSTARHRTFGRVLSYRLDSGAYRTRWGRLFLDGCIPAGAHVLVSFVTSDDDELDDPVPWQPAERGGHSIRSADLTPPLPSATALTAAGDGQRVFRRPTGRESPWAQIAAGDRFETYEAPVIADPGRFLWVVLQLAGTSVASPRVRELRIERPGHRLVNQLPLSWSRDEAAAAFLQRFLAPAEGMLHELDQRTSRRELLVDPTATPQEALSWLASFAGLVLDRRWPEAARRTLIAEAYPLFRRRGTVATLTRLIEIYLGYPPVIIEQWRLRGIPGGVLGRGAGDRAAPEVGRGLRVGGKLGELTVGGRRPGEDGYRAAAHRFSVLIPADLSTEQLEVVRSILDAHRPAHTVYEVCELGFGMRVGRRLHLNLTSVVGPGAGWGPAIVGQVAVGGDSIIGTPSVGAVLDGNLPIGAVRVG